MMMMMMTTTSNVSIALANAISSNQTNSSASKAKIPPLKLRTSMDCDNSSVTGEPSSAELMVRIFLGREAANNFIVGGSAVFCFYALVKAR